MHRKWGASAAVLAAVASLSVVVPATAARADGPGSGTPYVVTVGDSYISGEAGRWAGNTDEGESAVDALGSTAYDDNSTHTAPVIPGCDRSQSDEAYLGSGIAGEDLACSGATSATQPYKSGSAFKPGLDFYNDGNGHEGQALLLENFAKTHDVKLVAVTIGGNDFKFASIVEDCVEDFLLSPSWFPNYCDDDSSVTSNFTASNLAAVKAKIVTALENIHAAMVDAGYSDSQWTMVVQDYPSPIPNASGFRYSQSGFTRQSTGGCGFWNNDANYANATMLPDIDNTLFGAATATGYGNIKEIQLASAFNGHRLCESTVGRLEEEGLTSWKQAGAVDKSEWFQGIRTATTVGSDYQVQESLHPDYWAQLAERNCLRQSYNAGAPKGGTCAVSGTGLNSHGEPNMTLK